MKRFILLIALSILVVAPVSYLFAEESTNESAKSGIDWETVGTDIEVSGWADWLYAYDTRDMNHFRMDLGLKFPYRISFFTQNNINTTLNGDNFDTTNYKSEHNIWWNPVEWVPVDIAWQWQMDNIPARNDNMRFGVRWRLNDTPIIDNFFEFAHLEFSSQIHPLQTDFDASPGYGISFEHCWVWSIFPEFIGEDRASMEGFIDHGINWGSGSNHHDIELENRLKVRTISKLYVIGELVYSDFYNENWGARIGLEYKLPF